MRNQILRMLLRPLSGAGNVTAKRCLESIPVSSSYLVVGGSFREHCSPIFLQAKTSTRTFSTSLLSLSEAKAETITNVPIEGDLAKLLTGIDSILALENVSPAQLSDVAVTLAYLQVKGNRRIWGKVLEKASIVQDSFDAASLSNLLWATSTAEISHFKTIFELYGPATSLLGQFTSTQLSIIVEGLGRVGAADYDFFSKVSQLVVPKIGDYKPAELARILGGYASAGVSDTLLTQAVTSSLVSKAAELGAREVAQVVWALAKLKRADKPSIDALLAAVKGKSMESLTDAAATAWALGFLNVKPDADVGKNLAAAFKTGVADLKVEHAIQAAWGLVTLGLADKASLSSLFSAISSAVAAAPEEVDVHALALLSEAVVVAGDASGLDEKVTQYAHKVYALVRDAQEEKQSKAVADFKADVAQATAWALGARYRPDIEEAVAKMSQPAGHVNVEISVDVGGTKVAVVAAGPHYLSADKSAAVLGPIVSHQKVLEAKGYKVAVVPFNEWTKQADTKAKALYLLNLFKTAGATKKIAELQKGVSEPFDPYN